MQGSGVRTRRRGDVNFGDIADSAGPEDFSRDAMRFVRIALVTHLRCYLIFHGGISKKASFPWGACQRLFEIDVDAALHAS